MNWRQKLGSALSVSLFLFVALTPSSPSPAQVTARSSHGATVPLIPIPSKPATGFTLSLQAPSQIPSSNAPIPVSLRLTNETSENLTLDGGVYRTLTPYSLIVKKITTSGLEEVRILEPVPRYSTNNINLPPGGNATDTEDIHTLYHLSPGTYEISAVASVYVINDQSPATKPVYRGSARSNVITVVVH